MITNSSHILWPLEWRNLLGLSKNVTSYEKMNQESGANFLFDYIEDLGYATIINGSKGGKC